LTDFTLDGSNDADSRKDVPFGVSLILLLILGTPQKTILGREQAFSSQTGKILKVSYYRNYRIDFNQILHNDRDYQVVIAAFSTCAQHIQYGGRPPF